MGKLLMCLGAILLIAVIGAIADHALSVKYATPAHLIAHKTVTYLSGALASWLVLHH